MHRGILALGSNYGNREEKIKVALEKLASYCLFKGCSALYESKDWQGGEMPYLNSVVIIETELEEIYLNRILKVIELEGGRTPEDKSEGKVSLDIDIVVWENEILRPKDYSSSYFREGLKMLKLDAPLRDS